MLNFFKIYSMQRSGWFLLFVATVILISISLYFQHEMNLEPCVMCIYERTALFGIMFASLIGLLYPKSTFLRLLGLIIALGCAIKGFEVALTHLDLQLNPAPWKQCPLVPEFPTTLPLDKWIPFIFKPSAPCGLEQWQFLGLSMVQWILIIFVVYILLLALLLMSQFKRSKPQRRLFR
ncbi:disulfide bond formation protein DsbB [[Haemophilus] felis]|nr:disulfide bond formation protein DsbB [[Haemophilus] felis]